jgi:hypothetical protein
MIGNKTTAANLARNCNNGAVWHSIDAEAFNLVEQCKQSRVKFWLLAGGRHRF